MDEKGLKAELKVPNPIAAFYRKMEKIERW